MPRRWEIPEGLRVQPDGSWRVGELPVAHARCLRFMKQHLVFEGEQAFVVDGERRMPVVVEGPAFEVVSLLLDCERGQLRALLDDGSEEAVATLGINETTARFECPARGGRTRATLSRAAHQTLLENAEEAAGEFFLRVGGRRVPIRT